MQMETRDYNGTGRWSRGAIEARYQQYCRELHVPTPMDISPTEQTEGQVHRLKTVKRTMYGRANFDLLRKCILYSG